MKDQMLCFSSKSSVWFLLLVLLAVATISGIEVPLFPNDASWFTKAGNLIAGDVLLFNEGNQNCCPEAFLSKKHLINERF